MDKTKKKAIELIEHYLPVVYPYVGSGFMTGTENEEYKFKQAKQESIFLCDNMMNISFPYEHSSWRYKHLIFWGNVKTTIETMNIDFHNWKNLKQSKNG